MKMNTVLNMLMISLCVLVASCTKGDQTYVNYENELGSFDGNAYEYFIAQPSGVYDSLIKVMDRFPELKKVVQEDSLTVFAVTNRSFRLALNNINLDRANSNPVLPPVYLNTIDSTVLLETIAKYFVQDRYYSVDLLRTSDGYAVPTVLFDYTMHMQYSSSNASGFLNGGPRSVLFSDTNESVFRTNWIRVGTSTVDIGTQNAIINILPGSHDFGFGADFVQRVNNPETIAKYEGK